MKLGNKESYQDWLDFFRNLKRRGLKDPVLGVSDGAPGLIRAFEDCFLKTLRERCLVHKKMNILGKVPSEVIPEVKSYLNTVYYAPDLEAGKERAEEFVERSFEEEKRRSKVLPRFFDEKKLFKISLCQSSPCFLEMEKSSYQLQ